MNRKSVGLIARIAISVIGITLVVLSVDVGAALNSLLAVSTWGFITAVVIFQVGIMVRAVRWWVLLRSHTATLPLWKLVRLYYVGMFFNMFLPTGFGGDVVRAAELGTEVDKATAAATVLLDRMLGLMALFAIALVAAPFVVGKVTAQLLLVMMVVCSAGLVAGLVVLNGRTFAVILQWAESIFGFGRLPFAGKVLGALRKFNDAIALVGKDTGAVLRAFGISVVFNLLLILMHIVLSVALALDVPAAAYVVVVPLTSILLLVPSIAGIGVRESAFVYLLGFFTEDKAAGAALGFAVLLQNVISALIGFVWYIIYSVQKRGTEAEVSRVQADT